MSDVVSIDGSYLEGGGQILRISASLGAICKKPVQIDKIRAGRPNPGLSNQHVTGLELAAMLSDAHLMGCQLKSSQVLFRPKVIKSGSFFGDAKTAGSVALLAQITVPILAFAPDASTITLRGGTDADFAPPIDYISEVTSFYYQRMGMLFNVDVIQRGYYPQGGGEVKVAVQPVESALTPINLTEVGDVTRVYGSAFVAGKVPLSVAQEMRSIGLKMFRKALPNVENVSIDAFKAPDNRVRGSVSTFLFVIETSTGCRLAASGLGNPKGPPVAQLVATAIDEVVDCLLHGACCDHHMQDQLVLPMALAEGRSAVRTTTLTDHTQSAIYVVEKLLPVKFEVAEQGDGVVLLSCNGAGVKRN